MTPEADRIILNLACRGISLRADGNMLYASPTAKLTEEDRAAIRANKAAILEAVREPMPDMLVWQMPSGTVLYGIFRQGQKPHIPVGVCAWKCPDEEIWHPIRELPAAWGLSGIKGATARVVEEMDSED